MQVELRIEDIVRDALLDINPLEDVDVSDMVDNVIRDMSYEDILSGVDVEGLVTSKVERLELLDNVDVEEIVRNRVEELLDIDELSLYITNDTKVCKIKDEVECLKISNKDLKNEITDLKLRLDNQDYKRHLYNCQWRWWNPVTW